MKKSSKIIMAVIAVVAVGGFAYARFGGSKVKYETEAVARGSVVSEVSVTGSLEPADKVSLEPEVSARVVAVNVSEGDEVKAGDALVSLDSRDLQARIASQRAAVASASAQLAQLVAGPTSEDLTLSSRSVESAEAKLDAARQAKLDADTSLVNARKSQETTVAKADAQMDAKADALLDDYVGAVTSAGDAVNRLDNPLYTSDDRLSFSSNSAQAEIDATSSRITAKTALITLTDRIAAARAIGTLAAVESAYAANLADLRTIKSHLDASASVLTHSISLSSTTLATYQLNVSTAQTGVNTAINQLIAGQAAIDIQRKLNDADLATAQIALSTAESALNTAASGVTAAERSLAQAQAEQSFKKSGSRPEAISAQRARVAAENATLAGLESDLSKRSIAAPFDGIVTEVNVERGEIVTPGRPVVSLIAKGRFEIVSNISEVDIARLAAGQPVIITLDAFPRTDEWLGKVIKINPAEKVVEGVIFYETRVLFDEDDPRLKSGMTANLIIETARRDDVLRVPMRSVKDEGGKKTVETLVNGKPVTREITLGLEDNDYVELSSGLSEGDLVIVGTSN
jgi:HlyD family secretion protein